MDSSMVEENGNASLDPLTGPTAAPADNGSTTVLTSGANIVHIIPSTGSSVQVSVHCDGHFYISSCLFNLLLI